LPRDGSALASRSSRRRCTGFDRVTSTDDPEQFKRIAKSDHVEAKFTQALAISVEPKK